MPNLTVNANGESTEDLLLALEEIIKLIEEGYNSVYNSNTCSNFRFDINEDAR